MLDLTQLRKDPEAVAARLACRGYALDLDALRTLEAERKALQVRAEELQARRNALSKSIGQLKSRGEDASTALAEVAGLGDELKAAAEQNEARLEGDCDDRAHFATVAKRARVLPAPVG